MSIPQNWGPWQCPGSIRMGMCQQKPGNIQQIMRPSGHSCENRSTFARKMLRRSKNKSVLLIIYIIYIIYLIFNEFYIYIYIMNR